MHLINKPAMSVLGSARLYLPAGYSATCACWGYKRRELSLGVCPNERQSYTSTPTEQYKSPRVEWYISWDT